MVTLARSKTYFSNALQYILLNSKFNLSIFPWPIMAVDAGPTGGRCHEARSLRMAAGSANADAGPASPNSRRRAQALVEDHLAAFFFRNAY
jgi:hypothetical protein